MQTECQVHAHLAPPSAPSNVNAIKEKKRESFSTLTAWRILAGDIISRSGTAANNEEQPSVPLLPEQSVLTNHSFPEGWNEGTLEGNYELLDELGRGAFGRVVRARRKKDGAPACVKIISGSLQLGEKEREMATEEVRVLRKLHHQNIVRIHAAYHDLERTAIAMELCTHGDLEGWLKSRKGAPLSEAAIMRCFVQLCFALQHVHSNGIIHRDIKTSNIFLTTPSLDRIKLGDFGIAKALAPGASCANTMVGTPYYFSPELISDQPYSRKSDVWAAGCVLYELCSLKRPFQGNSVSAVCVKILAGAPPPLPTDCPMELVKLVESLLTRNPQLRPSINSILAMPYVEKHAKEYLATQPPEAPLTDEAPLELIEKEFNSAAETVEAVTVVRKLTPPRSDFVNGGHGRRVAEVECREEMEEGEVQFVFAS